MSLAPASPHPLARRLHDGVMQLLGTALLKTDMCEQLHRLGREEEISASLDELRLALMATIVEVRSIMADLPANSTTTGPLEERAAHLA